MVLRHTFLYECVTPAATDRVPVNRQIVLQITQKVNKIYQIDKYLLAA